MGLQPLFGAFPSGGETADYIYRGGPRYFSLSPSDSIGHTKTGDCDVHAWKTPAGFEVHVRYTVPCPQCRYPIGVAADEYTRVFEGKLTVTKPIACPGHWKEGGGRRVKCGWAGVIIDGYVHNPQCRAARPGGSPESCQCGGMIDEFEALMQAGQRT